MRSIHFLLLGLLSASILAMTLFSTLSLALSGLDAGERIIVVLKDGSEVAGEVVEETGGELDKFIGDGMMALFGANTTPEEGCRRALEAARRMSGALAKAIPDRVAAAEGGTACNLLLGGVHPDTGEFYTHYQLEGGGWGGGQQRDGNSAQCIAHGSTIRATPIEIFESRFPLRICLARRFRRRGHLARRPRHPPRVRSDLRRSDSKRPF